jgi:3-dehydroquinate dehydratase / shikimate dehydrogenase
VICCVIAETKKEQIIEQMKRAKEKADMIEIRLDYLDKIENKDILEIISKKTLPIILTCRKKEEGGKFSGKEEARIEILKFCIESGADYIDIELSSGKEIISDIIKNGNSTQIIVSYHNFKCVPDDIEEVYGQIKETDCDIIKIACMANDISDNLLIFKIAKKANAAGKNIIALCMGEKGEISRILYMYNGCFLTYGILDKGKETAPGQLTLDILKTIYRADKIKPDWKIYGLVGNPVSKSKGIIIHNIGFAKNKINSVYVNFLVEDLGDFLKKFRYFTSGLSVTMPFKEDVIKYLDKIDGTAKKIGGVNTIVKQDDALVGYNTDFSAAVESIEEMTAIEGKNVLLLGAGGVARAIGFGVKMNGGNLMITNRTISTGTKLASELGCEFKKLEEIDFGKIDILINATSVGMSPDIAKIPIKAKFHKGMIVFDSVYNPEETKLLKLAKKAGCNTISGIKMFVNQAEKQFEIWTGEMPQNGLMEKIIRAEIKK